MKKNKSRNEFKKQKLIKNKFVSYHYKQQKTLHNSLCKMLQFEIEQISENQIMKQKGNVGVKDSANVLMVVAKSNRAKQIIKCYVKTLDEDSFEVILPLNYEKEVQGGRHSNEYCLWIFNFMSCLDKKNEPESSIIKSKKDFPLIVSNKDWECILAPRVESE